MQMILAYFTSIVPVDRLDYDPLRYWSAWNWLIAALAYSALTFNGELSKNDRLIFSQANIKPIIEIVTIHFGFLAAIAGMIWASTFLYPHLPDWLTASTIVPNWNISPLDCVGFAVLIAMSYVERNWLYMIPEENAIKSRRPHQ